MRNEAESSDPSSLNQEEISLDELVAHIAPREQALSSEKVQNLPELLTAIAIEYLELVWRLETLAAEEIERVEELEVFYSQLSNMLTDQQYLSVELHIRAFVSIKYHYRVNRKLTST